MKKTRIGCIFIHDFGAPCFSWRANIRVYTFVSWEVHVFSLTDHYIEQQ